MSDIVEVTSSITLIEELDEMSLEDIEITFTGSKPILRLLPPLTEDDEVTTTFIAATPVVSLPLPPSRALPPVSLRPVLPPLKPPPSSRPPPPSKPALAMLPPLTLPPRTLPPINLPPMSGTLPPPSLPPPQRRTPLPPLPRMPEPRPAPPPFAVKEETLSEPSMRRPQPPVPLGPEPLVIVRRDEPARMQPYLTLPRFHVPRLQAPKRDTYEAIIASLGVVVLVAAGAMFALLLRDQARPAAPAIGPTAPAMIQTPRPAQFQIPAPTYQPPVVDTVNPEALPLESAPMAISPTVAAPTVASPPARNTSSSSFGSSGSAAGSGTLSFNSLPIAAVVLDGRPLGNTPITGVRVSPGPHSVLFIHPEHGRAARRVTVTAGGHQSVGVRF